ncbi:hypothetical protein NM688_g2197 [Phlebia brevispora]|uniref:Uncharacterized protein n=1 Tax=Phlebia brevispora TaxID=194682 RepID=A0ACC1T9J4_9APHY|nr:hypothetical protein NM688_g2197 [Phlebia brevispora]
MVLALVINSIAMSVNLQDSATLALPHSRSDWTRDAIEHAIESRKHDIAEHYKAIALLEEDILTLKHQLNTRTFIGRLPVEVLGEVFATYVADRPEPAYPYRPHEQDPPLYWWFVLLHVCHGWRQVALSYPRLWTTVYPTRPEVVMTLLRHSKNLPLVIRFTNGTYRSNLQESYKLVLAQMFRIRYAALETTPEVCNLLNSDNTTLEAPLLEELSIQSSGELTEIAAFQAMSMPRLHSLTLTDGTLLVLTSLIRPSITCLTLATYYAHPTEIIDVFASLPSLKSLDLEDVGEEPHMPGGALPPPSRTVTLPNLETLWMYEEGLGVVQAYLMSHLLLPDKSRVSFMAFARRPETVDYFAAILPCLHEKLRTASGSPMHPRALHISSLWLFQLILWTDTRALQDVEEGAMEGSARLDLALRGAGATPGLENDITAKFLSSLDLSNVTTLHLKCITFTPYTWNTKFSRMRKLEALGLESGSFDTSFIRAFARSRKCADGRNECIFPELKVLKIAFVKMKRHPKRRRQQDGLSCLTLALKWRQELGSYLQRLEFRYPTNMRDEDYETLMRQHVASEVIRAEDGEESWSDCGSDGEDSSEEDSSGDGGQDENPEDINTDPDVESEGNFEGDEEDAP